MIKEQGFFFHNRHLTKDFDCYIKESELSPPQKKVTNLTLPYMNGSYSIGNLYEPVFGNRIITYKVDIMEKSITYCKEIISRMSNWLLQADKGQLIDDAFPGYYFLAECTDIAVSGEEDNPEITVTFDAYPYMKRLDCEGRLLWDTFNFLTDYLQETTFEISGQKEIELYSSSSHRITPSVICNEDITIQFDGRTYSWTSGEHKDYRMMLRPGKNEMFITGEAIVQFVYNAEVL